MQLTKESHYAFVGLAYLASKPPGSLIPLGEIANANGLPSPFLAKIFHKLARDGILTARRGRGSGYSLPREPESISVAEILEAVEGPRVFQDCILWQGKCNDTNPCPLHFRMKEIAPLFEDLLRTTTLADYIENASS